MVNILKVWTEEEITLLKEKYPVLKKTELIKLFPDRSVSSIEGKAYFLKLKKNSNPNDNSSWTPVEINILKEKYFNTNKEELLKLLYNRDWRAVNIKASRLGLKRSKDQIEKLRKQTNLETLGVEYISQSKDVQDKIKKNCLIKYGVNHHTKTKEYKKEREEYNLKKYGVKTNLQLEEVKEKIRQTNLNKYGCENPNQNKEIHEKIKQTNLKKYGKNYGLSNEIIRQKIKDTCTSRYGVDCNLKISEIKEKIKSTNLIRYGETCPLLNKTIRDKQKRTCLEKFGEEFAIASEKVQEKIRQTNLKKYKIEYPFKSLNLQKKIIDLKTLHGTHNTSEPEKDLYALIKRVYPHMSIEQNYNKDHRYPFSCDYYIKELDSFIEYQGSWTHSKSPYAGEVISPEFMKKTETSKYYKNALEVYTIRDPLKRSYALKNNLNYLEIWNSDFKKGEKWLTFLLMKLGLPLKYNEEILHDEFEKINKKHNFSDNSNYNKIVEHFQQHFYREERRIWNIPQKREILVTNRTFWKKRDYLEVTNKQFLQGFKISGIYNGFSFFSTSWIKSFIEKYKISSIYDPCMGWGHRLLGANNIIYIGNDTCAETVQGNIQISNYFNMQNKTFYNMPAESFIPYHEYDAVFTCPPYFKTEIYEGHNTSTSKYSNYEEWLNIWWKGVIKSSVFNKPKYFAFVINNRYKEDMLKICLEEGLVLLEEIKVGGNNLNHFQRKFNNSYKGESLLILSLS